MAARVDELDVFLSDDARTVLQGLLKDVRRQILASCAARPNVALSSEAGRIMVSDVLQAFEEVAPTAARPRALGFRRHPTFALLLGMGTGLLTSAVFLRASAFLSALAISMGILLVSVWLAFPITTYIVDQWRVSQRSADYRKQLLSINLSRGWIKLEIALRRRASEIFGESVSARPLTHLLNELVAAGELSQEQLHLFKDALDIRNRVVHGPLSGISAEDLAKATKSTEDLALSLVGPS